MGLREGDTAEEMEADETEMHVTMKRTVRVNKGVDVLFRLVSDSLLACVCGLRGACS